MPRIKVELSAEFITPCFGGAASSNGSVSNAAELRETSIRGQIRWWMRACGLDMAEVDRILGSTDSGQSLVRFRKSALVNNRMDAEDWWTDSQYRTCHKYLWFFVATPSGRDRGDTNRVGQKCITRGSKFTLELSCRDGNETELEIITAFTILWMTFGSIGARSTRAGGCMKYCGITDVQGAGAVSEDFAGLEKASLPELWKRVAPKLGTGKIPPFRLIYDDKIQPNESNGALDWYATKWKIIRSELKNSQKGFWGIPFQGEFSTKLVGDNGKVLKTERMTSHIHLRPLRVKNDDTFYPAALVFDERMILQEIDQEAGNRALGKFFPQSLDLNGGEC